MKAVIDAVGRIVVPKPLRDALGLVPGSSVDVSRYGAGLQIIPNGRTARLVEEDGALVATGDTTIDDESVFGLIDSGRRGAQRWHSTRVSWCRPAPFSAVDEDRASPSGPPRPTRDRRRCGLRCTRRAAALDNGAELATRDARARDTYERVGVHVVVAAAPSA